MCHMADDNDDDNDSNADNDNGADYDDVGEEYD